MSSIEDTLSDYTIRTMRRDELAIAVDWAAAEGWNPGLHDAGCFYAADAEGFLMGLLDGEPTASISAVKYDDAFGFLGFYIVKPELRGQRYGWQIWQAGLARLKGCNVGLDGVVEQQENYLKSGFKLAHRNVRYEGFGRDGELAVATSNGEYELVELPSVPFEVLMAYDKEIFLCDRKDFLQCWIKSPQHKRIGLMHHQKLAGYGVLRPCRQGCKIGPLFADNAQFAEALFRSLVASVKAGSAFYLDVPSVNEAAMSLAEKYGMKRVFETARMYTQQAPELPLNRIFGITTFELG